VRWIVDQLGPVSGRVLDVGTGQGLCAIEFARRGAEVTSVDVDEAEQRVGRDNAALEGVASRVRFLAADARRLAFSDGTFDIVASLDALHHLSDGPAVFAEMRRLVKPDGRILLAELTAEGLAIINRVHASEGRVHPVGPVTVGAAVAWFAGHGLRVAALLEGQLHSVAILAPGVRSGNGAFLPA
jgi:ubiquinone/menaquinone biosynthesis C-methylase UbiE